MRLLSFASSPPAQPAHEPTRIASRRDVSMGVDKEYTALVVVASGVGVRISGYAGDALPSLRLLDSVVDVVNIRMY